KSRSSNPKTKQPHRRAKVPLHSLRVGLVRGPNTVVIDKKQAVSRTIQIRGDQTLEALHQAIVQAFERREDYSYEFQLDAGPFHPEGKRYVLPGAYEISIEAGNPAAGRVTETRLDALGLQAGQNFAYSPDQEDDWWHPITVEEIAEVVPKGRYPRIT